MSWQMAAVATIGAVTAKQQGTIGKFNEAVSERNAKVAEAEAVQIQKKLILILLDLIIHTKN